MHCHNKTRYLSILTTSRYYYKWYFYDSTIVYRVRPLSTKERKSGDKSVVEFPGNGQIMCDSSVLGQKAKLFSYNVVFEPGSTQDDVLEHSGVQRLLEMAVEGFSCTAFCYGQTGSGKTHTLTGPPGLV